MSRILWRKLFSNYTLSEHIERCELLIERAHITMTELENAYRGLPPEEWNEEDRLVYFRAWIDYEANVILVAQYEMLQRG